MEIISGQIIDDSIYLATELLEIAKKKEAKTDTAKKSQLARLIKDLNAIKSTQKLTDQVIRIDSNKASAKMFRSIARQITKKGFQLNMAFVDWDFAPKLEWMKANMISLPAGPRRNSFSQRKI